MSVVTDQLITGENTPLAPILVYISLEAEDKIRELDVRADEETGAETRRIFAGKGSLRISL